MSKWETPDEEALEWRNIVRSTVKAIVEMRRVVKIKIGAISDPCTVCQEINLIHEASTVLIMEIGTEISRLIMQQDHEH